MSKLKQSSSDIISQKQFKSLIESSDDTDITKKIKRITIFLLLFGNVHIQNQIFFVKNFPQF